MEGKAEFSIAFLRKAAQRRRVKGGRIGGHGRLLIGPLECRHVRQVCVLCVFESLAQKLRERIADGMKVSGVRWMFRQERQGQLVKIVFSHETFDDWKLQRQRLAEALA